MTINNKGLEDTGAVPVTSTIRNVDMSIRSDIKEELKRKREEEILREAAKILTERYPSNEVDEWGYKRHFF